MPHLRFAVFAALFSATAFAGVSRGPYPQNVDHDSATVAFRLDQACAASVRFGPEGQPTQTAHATGSGTEHFVKLEGLSPSTPYTFAVEACGQDTQTQGRFKTAPPEGSQSVHFAAMGDMGTGGTIQQQVAEAMANARPEFWLALGDNAYESGTDHEFQTRFFEPMAGLLANSPVFPAIGNHEYVTEKGQPWVDAFETKANNPAGDERYYSFDWGFVHVVALDSNVSIAEQKAWLEQDLANNKSPWTVVIFHHPVYSSGKHGSNARMQELIPTFEAGGVDLVLTGHDHNYERSHPMKGGEVVPPGTEGAITYLVVGTGGASNRPFATGAPEWSAYRSDDAYGYLDVRVEGGTLKGQLLSPSGAVLDAFSMTRDVPPPPVAETGETGGTGEPGAGSEGEAPPPAEGAPEQQGPGTEELPEEMAQVGCAVAGLKDLAAPVVVIAGLVAFRLARRRSAAG